MNKVLLSSCLLGAGLLLAACSDKKSANSMEGAEANAPQSVAAQERDIAAKLEAQKRELDSEQAKQRERELRREAMQPLQSVFDRWAEGRAELSRPNPQLTTDEQIKRLQALKAEAQGLQNLDSCSVTARNSLVEAMDLTFAVTAKVVEKKGKSDETIQKEINDAFAVQSRAEGELADCASR